MIIIPSYRFTSLDITSSKLPVNQHMLIENNGDLFIVASGDTSRIYKSEDKGSSWSQITYHQYYTIASFFHNRSNDRLYFIEESTLYQQIRVYYVDLTDDSVVGISTWAPSDGYANQGDLDIWVSGSNIYAILAYINSSVVRVIHVYKSTGGAFTVQDSISPAASTAIGYVTVVGTEAYFMNGTSSTTMMLRTYDMSTDSFSLAYQVEASGYNLFNYDAIAYDGSNILHFVITHSGSSINYLYSYNISGGTDTQEGEYDLSLMLDRNCSGIVPNEYEKAIDSANEIIYEIKSRRGGVVRLQDLSTLSDNSLIAITDNFCMNGDGDMFEYTEVMNDMMYNNRLYNGIVPFRKKYSFNCHPDYAKYWNEDDAIKIYDPNDVLGFWGYIITPSRNGRGISLFEAIGFGNELYESTYDKTYSADDTDTKQKDLIDNSDLSYCYRSSSIVGTTTTYDYDFSRECGYLFYLARFLERQVCRIEADGKIVTEAYDGITATGKSWTLYDGNQDVSLRDIKGLQDFIPGYYKGNVGVTSVVVRYKNNAKVTRPATPSELVKKIRLHEFPDPKIEEETEANQLGDNLYNIFSADTIFLGLEIEGEGFMEPGKTIQIQNQKQITITQDDFLIISYVYDPKQDIYISMILSDNIITPREFKKKLKEESRDIDTAIRQTLENQANIGGSSNTYLEYDDDDPAANQIDVGDLTVDSAWHELDLDSFVTVPSDAIGFFAEVIMRDVGGGHLQIKFRSTAQSNAVQRVELYTTESDYMGYVVPIPLDATNKFDYWVENGMDNVFINVLWWIRQPGG